MTDAGLAALQAAVDSTYPDRQDPVTIFFQFVFQQPPRVMWGGILLGAVLVLLALVWLWRRWPRIRAAVEQRPGLKWVIPVGTAAAIAVAAGAALKSYHFMHTDKRFCTGCHVFVPTGHAMVAPAPGNFKLVTALAGGHDTLQCTACHHSSVPKQAKKMLYWTVGVRDSTMPYRAPVDRHACEQCHSTEKGGKVWQDIAATAGHRAHLQSDTIHLRPKAECLTCHAEVAHKFAPQDKTCTQQGCHLTDDVTIRLGRMAGQQGFHCVMCHQFSREVPALATTDSARTALRRAGRQECNQCHAMQQKLADFDPAKDPHNGSCGMCHNPHTNVKPKDALKTCTDAGCHADTWKTVAFHSGRAHRRVAQDCQMCHRPHSARVDASDCVGCHSTVRGLSPRGGRRPRVPATFDTTRALRTMSSLAHPDPPASPEVRGKGDVPPSEPPPWTGAAANAPRPFRHERHTRLPCIKCHDIKSKTNFLRFKQPRGCLICHHQSPDRADCARCHADVESREFTASFVVRTAGPPPHERQATAPFQHGTHSSIVCRDCHRESVTLAATTAARTCQGCHDQHHDAGRTCATCHRVEGTRLTHSRETHIACTQCHEATTISRLLPDRQFCLGCHTPATDHFAQSQCTECHLFETPEGFRPSLARAP